MRSSILLLALLGPIAIGPAPAEPTYYMMVFAWDDPLPRGAHTFAAFVKSSGSDVEVQSISWLPENLSNLGVLRPAVRGRNLTLKETLALARANNASVKTWGPYQIKRELYHRAVLQVKRLQSGQVLYKALDRITLLLPGPALNCIHAVSDIDTDAGVLDTGLAWGAAASEMVVDHLRGWITNPETVHPEIQTRLGLLAN